MNRHHSFIKFFLLAGMIAAAIFPVSAFADTERINAFDARLVVENNGAMLVEETIAYNFGSNQRHGIFRDIPLVADGAPRLAINVLNVLDGSGGSYSYTVSVANDILRIKIGDPDVLVTGVKIYKINYEVWNGIRSFKDHDELYWNVTGTGWPVGIDHAAATVFMPVASLPDARMDCFTGVYGSREKQCTFVSSANGNAWSAAYTAARPMNPKEGLTMVLGFPIHTIANAYVPPTQNNINNSNGDYPFVSVLVTLIIIFITIVIIFVNKQSLRASKPIIPRELRGAPVVVAYAPPDNLPPIEIGTLLDRKVNSADISSVIIHLATRGYLRIRYVVKEIRWWPDKKDFEFVKVKDGSDLRHPAEIILFKFFFDGRDHVALSDLMPAEMSQTEALRIQAQIKKIRTETEDHLRDEGYFDAEAKKKSKRYMAFVSPIWLVMGFVQISFRIFEKFFLQADFSYGPFVFSLPIIGALGTTIILSAISLRLSTKLTPKGVDAFKRILGFREFLRLTEKDKLRLLNAPDLEPQMFEKFLPYAMVLGVEKEWAKKFEGITMTAPEWYDDPTMTGFSSHAFLTNVSLFNASFNTAFAVTSASRSGFGGGGFSGGGSGGGGGGSW